ncbi:MAG: hypothetical protein HUJ69_02900 [Lachnospiraceae bacterium]|nr:hypothetical protein [Lachnospiraceae bacterium]
MNATEKLLRVFESCGIFIVEDEWNDDLNLDSLQYVSVLVRIEDVFSSEIPDVYIFENTLHSFQDFRELIKEIESSK